MSWCSPPGWARTPPKYEAATCSGLEFLGLKLAENLNEQTNLDREIATADSRVHVLVIRAEEDWAIAAECWKLAHTSAQTAAAMMSRNRVLRKCPRFFG